MTSQERRELHIERIREKAKRLDVLVDMRKLGFEEQEAQEVYRRLTTGQWSIEDADAYIVSRLQFVEGAV